MSERKTMDFFEHQDQARSRTKLLLLLFGLAIAGTILAVYLVLILAMPLMASSYKLAWWQPEVFLYTVGGVLLIVGFGTAYKLIELSGGGKSVAELLGATPVPADTRDEKLLRYRNVVEEMAIASGSPVPLIYVNAGEKGINAFAAGYSPRDAVVCVTQGALDNLNRDQLQGVVAHEFSHIVHGDMRLNTRLMGILHGILAVGLGGYFLLRTAGHSRGRGSAGLAALGAGLLAAGYSGLFFARLIKAAVSRQREFLADASAVQFTRNPQGIAGALARIARGPSRGRVQASHAEEASHMFFANALSDYFLSIMATHPPVEERVRRIAPDFDMEKIPFSQAAPEPGKGERQAASTWSELGAGASEGERQAASAWAALGAGAGPAGGEAAAKNFAPPPPAFDSDFAAQSVGTVTPEHLSAARKVISEIPADLRSAAREPFGARAVILCLLMDPDPEVREAQRREVSLGTDPKLSHEVSRLLPAAEDLPPRQRLPLADLALSGLTELSKSQYLEFAALVEALTKADKRLSVFEFLVAAMTKHRLAPLHGLEKAAIKPRFRKPGQIDEEISVILSCLAWYGTEDSGKAQQAFERGLAKLSLKSTSGFSATKPEDLSAFSFALSQAALAFPSLKKQILAACSACVFADGLVTPEEAELLRAVSDSLDCPMPLVLASE